MSLGDERDGTRAFVGAPGKVENRARHVERVCESEVRDEMAVRLAHSDKNASCPTVQTFPAGKLLPLTQSGWRSHGLTRTHKDPSSGSFRCSA